MILINKIFEPNYLLIIWQEQVNKVNTGTRFIVGKIIRENNSYILRYNESSQAFKDAVNKGFAPSIAFRKTNKEYDEGVIDIFLKRIPSKSRSDFDKYLEYYRIHPSLKNEMSDFAILGYTGGRLPSDGFSFLYDFENATFPCQVPIEIAGFRHYSFCSISPEEIKGKQVRFIADNGNQFDSDAVKITCANNQETIGYVPRGQNATFLKWLNNGRSINGTIERVNGNPSKPNALVIASIS